jgi:hypothetical protein
MRAAILATARTARLAVCGAVAIGLVVLSGVCSTAVAGSGGAKLTVTATVLKRASLKVLARPSSVAVTAGDVARGYVEVSSPEQVAIKSNTSGGYLLEFASQGDFMRQILVTGLANDVQLSPSGGVVMQTSTGSGMTSAVLNLRFRFVLTEAAQVGTYSWPMQVSVTPL